MLLRSFNPTNLLFLVSFGFYFLSARGYQQSIANKRKINKNKTTKSSRRSSSGRMATKLADKNMKPQFASHFKDKSLRVGWDDETQKGEKWRNKKGNSQEEVTKVDMLHRLLDYLAIWLYRHSRYYSSFYVDRLFASKRGMRQVSISLLYPTSSFCHPICLPVEKLEDSN